MTVCVRERERERPRRSDVPTVPTPTLRSRKLTTLTQPLGRDKAHEIPAALVAAMCDHLAEIEDRTPAELAGYLDDLTDPAPARPVVPVFAA